MTQQAYLRYDLVGGEIIKVQQEWEKSQAEKVKETDQKALALYNKKKTKDAVKVLTDYSVKTAAELVAKWKKLDNYLFVKYIDGNVKKETDKGEFQRNPYGLPEFPAQPAYPEYWYKAIVYDAGERLMAQ